MSEPSLVAPEPAQRLVALYDASLPVVYGYLLRRCGDRAVAEDLTSQTFFGAVTALRRDPEMAVSEAWVIGIARHKLVDHWRAVSRDERLLTHIAGGLSGVDDPWPKRLDELRAHEVLAVLPTQYRTVLTLRYLDDLSVAQVAAEIDRTLHATEALLGRARRAFRGSYAGGSPAGGTSDRGNYAGGSFVRGNPDGGTFDGGRDD